MPSSFFVRYFSIGLLMFNLMSCGEAPPHSEKISLSNDLVDAIVLDPADDEIRIELTEGVGDEASSMERIYNRYSGGKHRIRCMMNAGIFEPNYRPTGLAIEDGEERVPLNRMNGEGNFYMQPNGVWMITRDRKSVICTTQNYQPNKDILFATQSGPMLVVDGSINQAFRSDSKNERLRNGVGILPNGHVVLAISKNPITFFDFANYFHDLGCENALYLDGEISKMYCPELGRTRREGAFAAVIVVLV